MKRFLSVFLVSFLFLGLSFAQNQYKAGIGVSNSFSMGTTSTIQTIRIPLNLTPSFRLEPIIGFYARETTEDIKKPISKSDIYKGTYSGLTLGSGFYFQQQNEKSNLYGGIQIAMNSLEIKDIDKSNSSSDETDKDVVDGWTFSPVIGGEYFFSEEFSIGAEVGVSFQKATQTSTRSNGGGSQETEYELAINSTETFASMTIRYFIF